MNLLLGVALAVGAPALKDGPGPATDTLVGRWGIETIVFDGRPVEDSGWTSVEFTADGGYALEGPGEKTTGRYRPDPKAKPATIDLREPVADEKANKPSILGIYKIDGDTLTVALRHGADRPTAFESPAGSPVIVVTLKRQKKD